MAVAEVRLAIIIRTTRAGPARTLALVGEVYVGLPQVVWALMSAPGISSQ